MALPKAQVLFGDAPEARALSNAEVSERFDELMKALDTAPTRTLHQADIAAAFGEGRGISFDSGPATAYDALSKAITPEMSKAISPDTLSSVQSMLESLKTAQPDLMKDLTTSSPVSTGLVAYDLEAPAKMLTPRPTPLRNRLPRRKGVGLAHQFKVISGFTGTATGIVDTTQTNFAPAGAGNALYYARGPKISYAGYDKTVAYSQFSVSDAVTWSAQYAGQGYQDIQTRVPAIAAAYEHLGWGPTTDLDTAIRKTIAYYVAQGTGVLPALAESGADANGVSVAGWR